MKKLPSIKSLKEKAWRLQSIYIRSIGANFQGLSQCYTCYRWFDWKIMNSGHYRHDSHDFDLRNVKNQCPGCNLSDKGRADEFYLHLVKEYGQKEADFLRKRAKENKYSRAELNEIIDRYKDYDPEAIHTNASQSTNGLL